MLWLVSFPHPRHLKDTPLRIRPRSSCLRPRHCSRALPLVQCGLDRGTAAAPLGRSDTRVWHWSPFAEVVPDGLCLALPSPVSRTHSRDGVFTGYLVHSRHGADRQQYTTEPNAAPALEESSPGKQNRKCLQGYVLGAIGGISEWQLPRCGDQGAS